MAEAVIIRAKATSGAEKPCMAPAAKIKKAGPGPHALILLLFASAALSAQETSVPSAVFGRAIDQESRTAISGVRIAAIDERGRERGAALSDSIGSYRITLEPGKYLLRAQRIGYQ